MKELSDQDGLKRHPFRFVGLSSIVSVQSSFDSMIDHLTDRKRQINLEVFFQQGFQFWVVFYSLIAEIAESCHVFAVEVKACTFDRILAFAWNSWFLEKRDV